MSFYSSVIRHGTHKRSFSRLPINVLSICNLQPRQCTPIGLAIIPPTGWSNSSSSRFSVGSVGFSTDTASSDSEISDKILLNSEILEEVTEVIQDKTKHPIGSLPEEHLKNAEEALLFWASLRDRSGFEKALAALLRLADEKQFLDGKRASMDNSSSDDDPGFQVRKVLINRVVDCWRTCWRDELVDMTPQEMLELVEKLEAQGVLPDCRTLTLIVDGMILRGDPLEAPLLAQWLLDRRVGSGFSDDVEMRPDAMFITSIIRAWAKSGRVEAPEMAEGLLQLMHEYNESKGWYECAPNTISYTAAIEAWSRSRRPDACQAMHGLLEEMKTSSVEQVIPDRVSYGYVLNCWAHARHPSGAQKAYNLLMEMLQLYEEGGNDLVAPETANFSKVMVSFARKGKIEKCKELFDRLARIHERTGDPRFEPDDNCWKALLVANTKSGNALEADRILGKFINRAKDGDEHVVLRRSYFVDVLVAWTKHKDKRKGSERAQNILMTLRSLSESGYPELLPDFKSFEKVIYSWSISRDANATNQIVFLLSMMEDLYKETGKESVKPTAKAFEMALTCLSRSDRADAPERAQDILLEMERRHASGDQTIKPTRGAYTSLMLTWLRSKRKEGHNELQKIVDNLQRRYDEGTSEKPPDVYMYSMLMDSWAKRGKVREAQALFDRMVETSTHTNEEVKPDVKTINILLKAWGASRVKNRAQSAESLFESIFVNGEYPLDFIPDRQTFNEMIIVWAKSGSDNAGEKAEHYLRQLQSNGFEPTLLSYRAVIDALTHSESHDAPARAKAILDELLNNTQVRMPLFKPYAKFLQSVARSQIPERNDQAKEILKSLQEGDVPKHVLLPPLK